MKRNSLRIARSLLFAGLSLLAAGGAHAANFGLRLSPTPAATNQADLTLAVSGTASTENATMPVLAGSTMDILYDSSSGVVAITQATLLGGPVQFTFGAFLHPCVVSASLTLDTTDENFPPRGGTDLAGEFDILVPVRFAGILGNNCNGDQLPYNQQLLVSLHGTIAYDSNSGLVELTDLATPTPFAPLTFTFPVWTFELTGTVTLNFEGTVQTIFDGDFDSGDTNDWSSESP
ncbi:MAG: hypothetical protein U0610_21125 [bacterium]